MIFRGWRLLILSEQLIIRVGNHCLPSEKDTTSTQHTTPLLEWEHKTCQVSVQIQLGQCTNALDRFHNARGILQHLLTSSMYHLQNNISSILFTFQEDFVLETLRAAKL
jgi:hypothetical protein